MSRDGRMGMVDREHPRLSLVRQCALLGLNRTSLYYRPAGVDEYDLELMGLIDRQYLETPFYGSRRMTAWLMRQGHRVNRKRVRRLMGLMGIAAIYRPPNTSPDASGWRGHKVYPYLLRGVEVKRVNQVWSADITYIPMSQGFMYLVVPMNRDIAGMYWHGGYPTPWIAISASMPWRRR